jgi:Amt family ammonium transporter
MDSASLTWVMISAALVLFMTPGLAFFYGGMDRAKNVLNMLMMNFWCLLVIPPLWIALGYSLSFSGSHGVIGDFGRVMLSGLRVTDAAGRGELATMVLMCAFAVIAPALISGAVADRMKFAAWAVFVPVWSLLVYAPVTYWVAAAGGWLKARGSLDFAGGTSIHVNAGIAALAAVLLLGRRRNWPREGAPPHSMPLVMLGTGILWFGWFGFNAGSALLADGFALTAFINTLVAAAVGGLVWSLTERIRDGHITNLGAASGIVAGLVAITPACAFVGPGAAMLIGGLAGLVCCFTVGLKFKLGFDDSLDVVGVHFVGGLVGSILIGFLADPAPIGWVLGRGAGKASAGLFFGGGPRLLGEQLLANGVTIVFSFAVTAAILKLIDLTIGLRVDPDAETEGLDITQHAETAYHIAERVGRAGH